MKNALIINLSTLHDYSLDDTIDAFVQLCNQYSDAEDSYMPKLFQPLTNKLWVKYEFIKNAKLISDYKTGIISTEEFLDSLSAIFTFLNHMPREEQHNLLRRTFTSSIRLTEPKLGRLPDIVDSWAKNEDPIYIITNSNPMDIEAVVDLFQKTYGHVIEFNPDVDLNAALTYKPVDLAKNVHLCTSYQFKALKAGEDGSTMSLLDALVSSQVDDNGIPKATGLIPLLPKDCTLVSQHAPDLTKGRQLGMQVQHAEEYFAYINHLKEQGHFQPSFVGTIPASSSNGESIAASSSDAGSERSHFNQLLG